MYKWITTFCMTVTICVKISDSRPPVTRQFIPPVSGYVPVYIRLGDTPLEDINLDLAEAFGALELKESKKNSVKTTTTTTYSPKHKDVVFEDISNLIDTRFNKDDSEANDIGGSIKWAIGTQTKNYGPIHVQKVTRTPKSAK